MIVDAPAEQAERVVLGARGGGAAREIGTPGLDGIVIGAAADVDGELHADPVEQGACHAQSLDIRRSFLRGRNEPLNLCNKLFPEVDTTLHAAAVEQLERRVMDLALERTGARHGAIFLWDGKRKGLAIDFHVVEGLIVNVPGALLEPARAATAGPTASRCTCSRPTRRGW